MPRFLGRMVSTSTCGFKKRFPGLELGLSKVVSIGDNIIDLGSVYTDTEI